MQILKGNNYKSVTIQHILETTNSLCYVYYDGQPLPFDSYFVSSNLVDLKHFQGYLQMYIEDKELEEEQLDYFIIYTNKTEDEMFDLIDWLQGKEVDFNCRCILVTCNF